MNDANPAHDRLLRLAQLMLPEDANPSGDVHGGVLMKLVDTAAGLAAVRHTGRRCVTVAVASMTFDAPVHVGDLLHVEARLVWTGRTSMEFLVIAETERVMTGERTRVSTAYFIYVALDADGRPTPVPPLKITTVEDQALWDAATGRRKNRPPATASS